MEGWKDRRIEEGWKKDGRMDERIDGWMMVERVQRIDG
jgi:hypothetical protein